MSPWHPRPKCYQPQQLKRWNFQVNIGWTRYFYLLINYLERQGQEVERGIEKHTQSHTRTLLPSMVSHHQVLDAARTELGQKLRAKNSMQASCMGDRDSIT